MECQTQCPLIDYCPVCGSSWDDDVETKEEAEGLPYCDMCEETIPPRVKRLVIINENQLSMLCGECVMAGIVDGSIHYSALEYLKHLSNLVMIEIPGKE